MKPWAKGLHPSSISLPPESTPHASPPPQYQSDVTVRMVRTNGEIKWKGHLLYLSHALRGEPVGLIQQSHALWKIIYGPLQIGSLDENSLKVLHIPAKVLPRCPVAQWVSAFGELCVIAKGVLYPSLITPISIFPRRGGRGQLRCGAFLQSLAVG